MTLAQIAKKNISSASIPSFPKELITRSAKSIPYIEYSDGSFIIIISYFMQPVVYLCGADVANVDINWGNAERGYIVLTPLED